MEASRKQTSVRERIEALYARYPREKYYYLTPMIDTASPLPDHFDVVAKPVKVSPDFAQKEIYPLKFRYDKERQEQVPDPSAGVAFSKIPINRMLSAINVSWIPDECKRIDDGTNRDIYIQQAGARAMSLAGMSHYCATRAIDIQEIRDGVEWKIRSRPPLKIGWPPNEKKWKDLTDAEREEYIAGRVHEADANERRFLPEKMETKAKLRVAREILAIPTSIDYKIVQTMEFLVIGIIFAPHARNAAESRLILERSYDAMMPAFPNAKRPVEIGGVQEDAPRQIGAPRGDSEASDADYEVIEDSEPAPQQQVAGGNGPIETTQPRQVREETETPPAVASQQRTQQPSPDGGEKAAQQTPSLPQEEPPALSGSSKITAEKITFLEAIAPLKAELLKLLGDEDGAREYYKLLLATTAAAHANEVGDVEKQGMFFRKLKTMVKLTRENPPKPADNPLAPFIEQRRRSLNRMSDDRIQAELDDILGDYPTGTDPLKIMPRISSTANREGLIELTMELIKWQMDEPARVREAQSKGGAR